MHKHSSKYKLILFIELLGSFIILPYLLSVYKLRGAIYFVLTALSIVCAVILKRYYNYNFVSDLNFKAVNKEFLRSLIPRTFIVCFALFLFAYYKVPERLFSFPLERPVIWVFVMLWYPIFSVLPQEFLYRSYFYHRFRYILPERGLWMLSGLLFGWAHIVLQNYVAVSFTMFGGALFAITYARTKSLAAAVFEHSLYGCWLFTLGLGVYFYHGLAVR